jgi:hypothetical protein
MIDDEWNRFLLGLDTSTPLFFPKTEPTRNTSIQEKQEIQIGDIPKRAIKR